MKKLLVILILLFSITIARADNVFNLAWDAPTQNADLTPLTDLAGYVIYYGESSGVYDNTVAINDPAQTTYSLTTSLQSICAVVTARDTSGNESVYSNEACKDKLPPAPPTGCRIN